jgi:acetyl-CoA C-acetyltransferase
MKKIYIFDAKRTAIGSFLGSLSNLEPQQYTSMLIRDLLERNLAIREKIGRVILGQVLLTSHGQNPARQASINAGIHYSVPAYIVNQVCGSGLRSVISGFQEFQVDENLKDKFIIVGGQESMSLAPHFIHLRSSLPMKKLGNVELKDSMVLDGLIDRFNNYHMGITAENLAKKYNISREEQDNYSYNSQKKASQASQSGRFKDEILPISISLGKDGEKIFDADEFIKHDSTIEKLSKLKPAFEKDGTVTAGNSSGINDCSAILLIGGEEMSKFLEPIAEIISFADDGVEPEIMGIGPVGACNKALKLAGWTINDLDLIELNEAFASQVIAVSREMKWDMNNMNVNGGSIALGHPIGASGARCLTTLIYEMKKRKAKNGIVSLCIGGGMGIAMCVKMI